MASHRRAAPANLAPHPGAAIVALPAVVALVALGLLAAAVPGAAQTSCESGLRDATKSYEAGLFGAVPEQLAPCFQQRTSRARQAEAYALLARTYLAADEPAKARQAVSDMLRANPAFEAGPPPRFAQLVAQVRREESTVQVTSVSKSSESLREAPATVMVVTAEEIERRGYLDLEQVLHDLPGFDISRTGDLVYSSIFQRGFHAQGRNLLLLDGVEQNDISSNAAQLSRQYALSNIDRVEVVYGPASTMYGANAFTGVINIITKEPEALIAEDKRLGLTVQATAGGLNTRYADLTAAGRDRSGTVSWSVTSRLYKADDESLSRFPAYRFDYSGVNYRNAVKWDPTRPVDCGSSPLFTCTGPSSGQQLSDAGVQLARQLDSQFLQANRFHFSDPTDDWSVYAKLKISNLLLGFELWRTQEGLPALGSLVQDGQSTWAPRQTLAYLKYTQPVGRDLTFNAFVRFQQAELDPSRSRAFGLSTFANGTLFIQDLLPPSDQNPFTQQPALLVTAFRDLSNQIRGELNLVYEPSPRFSAVGGVELWKSSIQSSVDQFDPVTGDEAPELRSPFQVEHTDVGAYGQAAYKLAKALRLVLGGRLSYNALSTVPYTIFVPSLQTISGHGYGTLFSPRAALVYTPASAWVLKAIYSEAFKDPTDAEKFGNSALAPAMSLVVPTEILAPERVRNFELSAGWQPHDSLSVEASAYQASYTKLVTFQQLPTACFPIAFCGIYQNSGDFRIRGLQLEGRYRVAGAEIWGNYTLTSPYSLDPRDIDGNPLRDAGGNPIHQLRIGDIASHQANLGINRDWLRRLNTDLRLNWVGARPTGPKTTDAANPLSHVGSYADVAATLSYRGVLPGTTLQLIVDNLLNRGYFDPGTRPELGVAMVPQPGRTIFLRIITGLGLPFRASAAR
jgi:outer membrane receptor for ferrienterochelin and colicins